MDLQFMVVLLICSLKKVPNPKTHYPCLSGTVFTPQSQYAVLGDTVHPSASG